MKKYSDLIQKIDLFVSSAKVFGPYKRRDGRSIVIVKNDDGTTRTVSWPKYIMEQHLGRPLDPNTETVDHLDCDFNNNAIKNLRIVPRDIHSGDDVKRTKLVKFECPVCKKKFEREPRLVRDKSKKGKAGPFCSKTCAGRFARQLQLGLIDKLPAQPYIESEYYRRKNVAEMIEKLTLKYGQLKTSASSQ